MRRAERLKPRAPARGRGSPAGPGPRTARRGRCTRGAEHLRFDRALRVLGIGGVGARPGPPPVARRAAPQPSAISASVAASPMSRSSAHSPCMTRVASASAPLRVPCLLLRQDDQARGVVAGRREVLAAAGSAAPAGDWPSAAVRPGDRPGAAAPAGASGRPPEPGKILPPRSTGSTRISAPCGRRSRSGAGAQVGPGRGGRASSSRWSS